MAGGLTLLGVEVGDWATWISAAGTFAAVIVALRISIRDANRRDEDRHARAKVFAAFLFADVGVAQHAFELAETELSHVAAAAGRDEMLIHLVTAYQLIDKAPLTKIVAHLDKVAELPARHAVSLASLPDIVKALKSDLPQLTQAGKGVAVSVLKETADEALNQVRLTKAGLDDFMTEFKSAFVR